MSKQPKPTPLAALREGQELTLAVQRSPDMPAGTKCIFLGVRRSKSFKNGWSVRVQLEKYPQFMDMDWFVETRVSPMPPPTPQNTLAEDMEMSVLLAARELLERLESYAAHHGPHPEGGFARRWEQAVQMIRFELDNY